MKVLCSQEVVSPHLCGVVPCQITAKASAPQVPWFVLCLWLKRGIRENMAYSKPIDFCEISCGSFRKLARNLIEIAQRKSQRTTPRALDLHPDPMMLHPRNAGRALDSAHSPERRTHQVRA